MIVLHPRTVEDASAMAAEGGVFGAGLTALGVPGRRGTAAGQLVDLSGLAGLSEIVSAGHEIRMGAITTLEAVRRSALVEHCAPTLVALLRDVASLSVRHLATLGGNIAWSSGDLPPVLLSHAAVVESRGERFPLPERPVGRLVESVILPARPPDWSFAEKVGFRSAFSPTVVTVAASARIVGGRLRDPVLALGGGPNPLQRLAAAEAILEGAPLQGVDADALHRAILREARCGEGNGLSAAHRARVAANLLVAAVTEARL